MKIQAVRKRLPVFSYRRICEMKDFMLLKY